MWQYLKGHNGTPLQYFCLENPMDGGAWWAAVHRVAEGRMRLSDFTFTFHFRALEKERATHSSVLAWRIPGTGEPGGLLSIGSHRVGHDWSDLAKSKDRWFGYESEAVTHRISALTKRCRRASSCLLLYEDTVRSWQSSNQKRVLSRTQPCWHLGLAASGSVGN